MNQNFQPNYQTLKKIDKYVYDLRNKIGDGSYSTVYLGVNEETQQQVAIKVMSLENLRKHKVYDLIFSEITNMKKFNSEHIIYLIDIFQTVNNLYMILEYANQGDLGNYINKKKALNQDEAIHILKQIIKGVKTMLDMKVMHRDLKPDNVLIKDGIFKLADFGFAFQITSLDQQMQGEQVGTPLFCSPQCIQKLPYSSKTDVWSIGVIFYLMIFGHTPWFKDTVPELIKQINDFPQITFDQKKSQISKLCQNFLTGCLQYNEKDRYSWEDVYNHRIFGPNGIFIHDSNGLTKILSPQKNLKIQKLGQQKEEVLNQIQYPPHLSEVMGLINKLQLLLKRDNLIEVEEKLSIQYLLAKYKYVIQQSGNEIKVFFLHEKSKEQKNKKNSQDIQELIKLSNEIKQFKNLITDQWQQYDEILQWDIIFDKSELEKLLLNVLKQNIRLLNHQLSISLSGNNPLEKLLKQFLLLHTYQKKKLDQNFSKEQQKCKLEINDDECFQNVRQQIYVQNI